MKKGILLTTKSCNNCGVVKNELIKLYGDKIQIADAIDDKIYFTLSVPCLVIVENDIEIARMLGSVQNILKLAKEELG